MRPAVKLIIETRINYIENKEFDKLFKIVQDYYGPNITHELAEILQEAGMQPLDYMDFIPEGYFHMSTMSTYTIPPHIKKISYKAFSYSDLQKITIPGTVRDIEDEAFMACDFLEYVKIEEGVEYISGYAFYGCDDLQKMYLPRTLKYIGDSAFGSTSLKNVFYEGGIEEFKNISNYTSIFTKSNIETVSCNNGIIRRDE